MAKQKEIKLNSALPYDINAEKAFLGCVLLRPSLLDEVEVVVSPQDFFDEINKTVYTLILEMASENVTPDLVTLHSYILKRQLQGKINVEYIAGLSEFVAVPENIIEHAKIIKNNSMRRKIINFGMEAISIGNTYEKKVDEGCAQIQQKALDLDIAGDGDTLKSIQEIYKDWYVDVERNHDNSISFTGIDTGYHELNEITGGLQDTDLIILAGRPSMGKTAFALNLASNVSINVPTLIFSLEMSSDQLMTRMVGLNCGIEQQKIKQGATTKEDMEIINEAWSEVITPRKMFIDDKAGLNISSMCSIARRMKKKEDIGLIIIDYLQLITTNNGFGSREQEVSHISRTLKALAKELNVPVVALSQLNRKLEERTCKRPKNSDLRESGSLEQDSDVIIFLYRDEVYNKSDENPEKGKAEIIISKQRNGPLGNVNLKFLETIGKFDNLDYF